MLLYLDNSFLNRPFDNSNVKLNRLEAEILFLIVDLVSRKKLFLAGSSILEYENSLNPFPEREIFIRSILSKPQIYQDLNQKLRERAEVIKDEMKIDSIDALHIASAEALKVDFFITCDYNILKKYRGDIKVISPLDFIKHYEDSNN